MKTFELRADPSLLKSNFDGYKLSLEPIPVLKLEITRPHQVNADTASGFPFLHSSLFHNHLIADPWLPCTAYFLDSTFSIQKVEYDTSCGKLKALEAVFRVGSIEGKQSNYNADFKFISEKFVVLSDGVGNLAILDSGDRQKRDEWKQVHILQPLAGAGFIVKDARFAIEKGEKFIHCLILKIEQIYGKFLQTVDWLTLKQSEGVKSWDLSARRTIQGKGSLHYLALDPKCKSIIYSSNHQYKFTFDSVNGIVEEDPSIVPSIQNLQVADSESLFKWTQDGEDISVTFNAMPQSTKGHYAVNCERNHVEVKCQSTTLLDSDLFGEIDTDLTTWSFQNGFLQLNLIKLQPELTWPYLIPGSPVMEVDPDNQPDLLSATMRVADLNSQMEECDFGDGQNQDEEFFIERLDSVTGRPSHKVFLGSNHPLFSTTLRPGFPQAVAVRNDVDCCLWLQQASHSDENEWSFKHDATLHAFAYIAASKIERKYLMCSPDINLAVISETSRHLFIYKNSYNSASGLRKRTGPQLTIGQQKLVSFDGSNGDILGMSVENEIILLLTENAICCLQLSIEE